MILGYMSAIIAQRAVVLELCIPTAARSGEILSLSTAPRLGQPRDMLTERTQDMGDNVGPNGLSRGVQDLLPCSAIATTSRASTKGQAMAHNFAINDDVHHQLQGPQGRAVTKQRSVYTIVTCLPIEADGRPRYRIKSKTENVERVVTEEQISRLY